MTDSLYAQRRQFEQMDRDQLQAHQLRRLNQLLAGILPHNRFYAEKLVNLQLPLTSLDQLPEMPLTTKDELVSAATGELPSNQTFPHEDYQRMHRTSGTKGQPLSILDTAEDWQGWIEIWQYVLDAAHVTTSDRALMAFSFGPFVGFWSAYDALAYRGAMVIPAGGLTTQARIELLFDSQATLLCCTPTYALRMQEVAAESGIDLRTSSIRGLIVAGEPGGSLPSVRRRIESAWDATVIDHAGATEIGPWGYADPQGTGLHVCESDFIAEFLPQDDEPDQQIPLQELVLTALFRRGMPVIRYRTGDLVRPTFGEGSNRFVFLEGGVLGRADDMVVVRGVNIFPSAIEEILRSFANISEFRVTATRSGAMDDLRIEVENQTADSLKSISDALQSRLGLRIVVDNASPGSLPRSEAKSKRFVDLR